MVAKLYMQSRAIGIGIGMRIDTRKEAQQRRTLVAGTNMWMNAVARITPEPKSLPQEKANG
jgi:hypothetical protein